MIIAASLLALLVIAVLLASGNAWSNVLSSQRNELVFAGRNQAYGAYVIRQEHHRVMIIAFIAAVAIVGLALALPKLFTEAPEVLPPSLNSETEVIFEDITVSVVTQTTVTPPPSTRPNPDQFSIPVAVDSVAVIPEDTTTHTPDPGPVGPVGPIGPIGPVGPVGPETGGGGTTVIDGWQADSSPEYPGGLDALYDDLKGIVRYPQIDMDHGREGKVYVSFVVNEDGLITDVTIGRGVSATLDAEAQRSIRQLKKRWKPGKFQGKDVRVRYTMPINFKIARN